MHSTRGQLLCVALLALLGLAWSLDAPLLMWSGSDHFAGKNLKVQSTVQANQLTSILSQLTGKQAENLPANIASVFGNEASPAEVIVLYLEPMIRTDQLSRHRDTLGSLSREMNGAKTSVSVPFVAHNENPSIVFSAVKSMASSLPSGAQVLYTGKARSSLVEKNMKIVNLADITANHEIFSNGVLDVLIVELSGMENSLVDKLAKDDAIISQVQSVVRTATQGKYIALFTSETVYEPAISYTFGQSTSHLEVTARSEETDSGSESSDHDLPWGAYFPYWFWEGLITLLFFFGVAYIIIWCIMTLQTPSYFLMEKKKD